MIRYENALHAYRAPDNRSWYQAGVRRGLAFGFAAGASVSLVVGALLIWVFRF